MISNSPTLAQMVFCSVVMILQFAEAGRFATRQRRARLGHRFAVG
jgi:hypothetical protein